MRVHYDLSYVSGERNARLRTERRSLHTERRSLNTERRSLHAAIAVRLATRNTSCALHQMPPPQPARLARSHDSSVRPYLKPHKHFDRRPPSLLFLYLGFLNRPWNTTTRVVPWVTWRLTQLRSHGTRVNEAPSCPELVNILPCSQHR